MKDEKVMNCKGSDDNREFESMKVKDKRREIKETRVGMAEACRREIKGAHAEASRRGKDHHTAEKRQDSRNRCPGFKFQLRCVPKGHSTCLGCLGSIPSTIKKTTTAAPFTDFSEPQLSIQQDVQQCLP